MLCEHQLTNRYIAGAQHNVAGTASNSDYGLRDGTLTIPAGVTTMPLSIDQIDDGLDEDDETVTVALANPSNAILGLYPSHTHTILDDDMAVTASFVVASETVVEGDSGKQVLTAEVKLDRPSGRTVTVGFAPDTSQFYTATLGVDYEIMTPSPLVFPPGTTSQTITFAILGDTVQDGSDKLGIDIDAISGAYTGSPWTHFVQIDNDDCLGFGAYRVCPDTAPTTDVTIDSTTFQGTSFDAGICASRQPPGWIESGQPSACFIVANNITIGTARFEGFRPVVLVALNSITINTLLDAGSHFDGAIGFNGPGFNPSVCPASPTLGAGAGGAGGSFMTSGGNGGSHGPSAPGGTAASAVSSAPGVLRGGCSGQQPATNTGGAGGGAVYLLAGNTITIAPNAALNASGASGYPGRTGDGGDGGGSGGMIVMWAAAIQASQAHLLANGGGGAEGSDGFTQNSVQGGEVDFAAPFTPAPGGSGSQGGDGGAGAVQGIAAKPGSNASSSNGAGGGGGGLGYILVHPSLTNAVVSPTPSTF